MAFSTQAPVTFPRSAIFRDSSTEFYATSQFTPPTGCHTRMATTFLDGRNASAQWDFEFGNNATMTCSDPIWVLAQRSYLSSTQSALFNSESVAGVCPSGYDVVGTARDRFSNAYFDYNIDGGGQTTTTVPKTQAFCCPSGFTTACYTGLPEVFQTGDSFYVPIPLQIPCQKFISTQTALFAVVNCFDRSDECTQTTTTVTTSSFTLLDRGYKMAFDAIQTPFYTPATMYTKNKDVSSFSTDQSIPNCPEASATVPTKPQSFPPIVTSGDEVGSNHDARGLSAAAIGGIVGGIAGLLLVGVAIVWIIIQCRKKPLPSVTPSSYHDGRHPSEVHGTSAHIYETHGTSAQIYETHGNGMVELSQPGSGFAHELFSSENRVKSVAVPENAGVYELPSEVLARTPHTPATAREVN